MSITIPSRDISIADKKNFRQATADKGMKRMTELGIVHDNFEVTTRDLAPSDVGLATWATSPLIGGWNPWIQYNIARLSVVCIYRVLQLSNNPSVTSLRFWKGGSVLGTHEIEACYSGLPIIKNLAKALMSPEAKEVLDRLAGRDNIGVSPDFGSPMEAYFGEPYVYEPEYLLRIEVKARNDGPGDYLVLGGYVIERRGTTIQ